FSKPIIWEKRRGACAPSQNSLIKIEIRINDVLSLFVQGSGWKFPPPTKRTY
ncbi:4Fe-4S dicluster domain protein, partial [Vibrio cholerae HC-37A1]